MLSDVVIEMMSSDSILWRCLHGGPLTDETVDTPKPHSSVAWDRFRSRNVHLLEKLTDVYGSCAVIARDGQQIVGQLRFYPKVICSMAAPGPGLCLQQPYPNGPADDLAEEEFPPLDQMADKTLFVHCMMTGSRLQHKGIGSRMVATMIDWASEKGWAAIEADAYADLPCIYAVTGQTGRAFWEKFGFQVADSRLEPAFDKNEHYDFVKRLLAEAVDRGIDAAAAKTRYTMRLDLQVRAPA